MTGTLTVSDSRSVDLSTDGPCLSVDPQRVGGTTETSLPGGPSVDPVNSGEQCGATPKREGSLPLEDSLVWAGQKGLQRWTLKEKDSKREDRDVGE